MSNFLSNTRQLVAVAEVTNGTFVTPTESNFDTRLYDLSEVSVDVGSVQVGELADGTFKKGQWYSGQKKATVSFATEVQWSGDTAVEPKWWKFLKVCGFIPYDDGLDKGIKYDGTPTCGTLSAVWRVAGCGASPDGYAHKLRGMAGTFSIGAENVGAPLKANFEMSGVYMGHESFTGLQWKPTGVDDELCEKFLSSTFVIGSTAYRVQSFNIVGGGTVSDMPDQSNAEGIAFFRRTNGNATIDMKVIKLPIATDDLYELIKTDSSTSELVLSTNHYTITMPLAQLYELGEEGINEFMGQSLKFQVNELTMLQK